MHFNKFIETRYDISRSRLSLRNGPRCCQMSGLV